MASEASNLMTNSSRPKHLSELTSNCSSFTHSREKPLIVQISNSYLDYR